MHVFTYICTYTYMCKLNKVLFTYKHKNATFNNGGEYYGNMEHWQPLKNSSCRAEDIAQW
jgi:hypothetical protein